MKVLLNVYKEKEIDLMKYHNVVIFDIYDNCLDEFLNEIHSSNESVLVSGNNSTTQLKELVDEMESRYNLMFGNKCRKWYSQKLRRSIKSKIVIVNAEKIRSDSKYDVLRLLQKSSGCGMYIVVGLKGTQRPSNQNIVVNCPLRLIVDNKKIIGKEDLVND